MILVFMYDDKTRLIRHHSPLPQRATALKGHQPFSDKARRLRPLRFLLYLHACTHTYILLPRITFVARMFTIPRARHISKKLQRWRHMLIAIQFAEFACLLFILLTYLSDDLFFYPDIIR